MSSDLDAVRKGLEGHLPSAKNLSDEYIGILDKYLLTEPLALAEADVDFLTCQNVPVPLLTLIRAYKTKVSDERQRKEDERQRQKEDAEAKRRRDEDERQRLREEAEAKKQKVAPDMSILILERLIGTLPATPPTIEDLSQFLLSTLEKVPVTSQVFQSLNRDVGGTDYVRVCTEQETANIVATFSTRIEEIIHTSGTEELTAYAVTKLLFDVLYQIDRRMRPPLQLGLVYDKNATTKNTWSVPNIESTRPDGTLTAAYTLLLAGEEKPEDEPLASALKDVKKKFNEPFSSIHYGRLDYIPAYAAAGKRVQWFAIKTQTAELVPILDEIDFSTEHGRAKLLLVVVNIYKLLLKLKEYLPKEHGGLQMFKKKTRHGQATVTPTHNSIVKVIYNAPDYLQRAATSFAIVTAAYDAAKTTTHIVHAVKGPFLDAATGTYRVVTRPLGMPVQANNEEEIRQIAHDLLHALVVLHNASICHRDLRKPNICSYKDSSPRLKHMLIDLESVAHVGDPPPLDRFDSWEDATLVNGQYVEASDLFQLAKVLKELAVDAGLVLSQQGRQFLHMLSSKARSASSLLDEQWVACNCDRGVSFSQD